MAEVRFNAEDERLALSVPCEESCKVAAGERCKTGRVCGYHRTRLEAARRAQSKPIKLSDPDAFERTRAAMGTYVPEVGARVLVGIPEAPKRHNTAATVISVTVAPKEGGLGRFSLRFSDDGAELDFTCRVSPLPASPIDVECPCCGSSAGQECESIGGKPLAHAQPGCPLHNQRIGAFLALTGGKDSRPGGSPAADGRPNVGSERGDSGIGEAAGAKTHKEGAGASAVSERPSPAAPSGFKPPETIHDVPCETCGVVGRNCHERIGDGPWFVVPYHALRTAAYEARRERPEAPKRYVPNCIACGQARWKQMSGLHCADCKRDNEHLNGRAVALDQRIAKARADLDRPLPKPDALRTWPESWSSAGWESDP